MKTKPITLSMVFASIVISSGVYADTINTLDIISANGLSTMDISDKYGVIKTLPNTPLSSAIGSSTIVATPYRTYQDQQYVYTANPVTNTISVFRPQLDGSLLYLSESALTGRNPSFLAVDASSKHLYVTNKDDYTVYVYNIDPETGALTRVDVGDIVTDESPTSISLGTAKAIVTNRGSNTISMYEIDPATGNLSKLSSTVLDDKAIYPILSTIVRDEYVQVLSEGYNGASIISQFSLPETGGAMVKLQPETISLPKFSQFMVKSKDENYMFVASLRDDYKDSIAVYDISVSGTLTLIQTMIGETSLSGESSEIKRSLALDPRGLVLYATNAELDTVSAYEIESATGKINSVPVTVQDAEDPVVVADKHTQGEPTDIVIEETSGVYESYTASFGTGDNAEFNFDLKNSNSNDFLYGSVELCVKQYDGLSYAYDDCSEEECEVGEDFYSCTIPGYTAEGGYFLLSYVDYCGEDLASCSIAVEVSAEVPSTDPIKFYIQALGGYDIEDSESEENYKVYEYKSPEAKVYAE